MSQLPADAPDNARDAFARINAVKAPSIDDLKLMVFIEASARSAYYELAETAPSPEIAELLQANGREELAHAHRVSKAIKILSGEDFEPPAEADNPYVMRTGRILDKAILERLVVAEQGGDDLYATWADHTPNAEAAAIFRLNGSEEMRHAGRATKALELIGA